MIVLLTGLALWMFGCAYSGYHRRFVLFFIVLLTGMTLNTIWMVLGLDAKPFSPPAMTAHLAALMYGIAAFGMGWIIGRIVDGIRESRVEDDE
ncbi:hypothetical protein DSW25_10125 [Sulfitobacter donghicola DSW-25 = KCTC 12864 = JCM 14565]|uniref:Uncharacterized protein n=1 Tax=Sulfitobacter donghicola DSW-25 = KCTC 12864 = JCM 14565 TaxID=1300350 RepID=A0A073IG85_9RHOB|nr:hypothetical protein DSW25_10125 [Sulfitobacter donghicola DSW-25 = KCTC 12864 = JCM 14565]